MNFKKLLKKWKLRKVYVKLDREINGFKVFIVNGEYVRDYVNEEFTNFGQHYRFHIIPSNEFWIDQEHSRGEMDFFVDHLLIEYRLMSKGKTYAEAITEADETEKKERQKSKLYKSAKNKVKLNEKIHKKLVKMYSNGIQTWIVNGELVRDYYNIDFTEGGHDFVYHFVPKNEVWLDDDIAPNERKFVFLHEIHERNLMAKGMNYYDAHRRSSLIEHKARQNPEITKGLINEEVKRTVKE